MFDEKDEAGLPDIKPLPTKGPNKNGRRPKKAPKLAVETPSEAPQQSDVKQKDKHTMTERRQAALKKARDTRAANKISRLQRDAETPKIMDISNTMSKMSERMDEMHTLLGNFDSIHTRLNELSDSTREFRESVSKSLKRSVNDAAPNAIPLPSIGDKPLFKLFK